MTQYIGQHLINNDIEPHSRNCGYCGKIVVESLFNKLLDVVHGKFMALSLLIVTFFYSLSLKSAEKVYALNSCTNRTVKCDLCSIMVWSYNIKIHYAENHLINELPERYLLKNDEIE